MKLINYLYYKIYKANLKGSLNDIAPTAAMLHTCLVISLNLFVLVCFLRKVGLLPFFFRKQQDVIVSLVSLFVAGYFYFLHRKRYTVIIENYENENESERKRGNRIIWIYIILSFLMLFEVAFYKPGIL